MVALDGARVSSTLRQASTCARQDTKFSQSLDACKTHKILQNRLGGASGARVVEVGKPFRLGGYRGELVQLG